jgi:hypothetical protein
MKLINNAYSGLEKNAPNYLTGGGVYLSHDTGVVFIYDSNGNEGVNYTTDSFDQDLNTTDDVVFNSLDVTGQIDSDELFIGSGSTVAGSIFGFTEDSDVTSGLTTSAYSKRTSAHTSSLSANMYGEVLITEITSSGNVTDLISHNPISQNTGSGTANFLAGSYPIGRATGSGGATSIYGSYNSAQHTSSGSSTDLVGAYGISEIDNSSGSVNYMHGLAAKTVVTNGDINNSLDVLNLKLEQSSGTTIANAYFIHGENPGTITITADALFIKDETGLNSEFDGTLTSTGFILDSGTYAATIQNGSLSENISLTLPTSTGTVALTSDLGLAKSNSVQTITGSTSAASISADVNVLYNQSTSPITLTIETTTDVANIMILNNGGGNVTLVGGTGVTFQPLGFSSISTNRGGHLIKISDNSWTFKNFS